MSAKSRLRPRALYLYIAGDNDLSEAGLSDVQELCQEGSSDSLYAAVEIDTEGEHTGSIRYEITPLDYRGVAHRVVIERLAEQDTGNPRTLRNFLRWARDRYPARESVVVIGGHGSGFRSRRRSVGQDDRGSMLEMPEVRFVLEQSGIGTRSRVAILGFDACLMCMLEIANHFRNHARILVGSQQTEPGDGWPYDRVLRLLKDVSLSIQEVADGIAEAYVSYYRRQRLLTNVTQSAIDLDKTSAAMDALSGLGKELRRCWEKQPSLQPQIRRARKDVQSFDLSDYVDGVDLARLLLRLGDGALAKAAADFQQSLATCIIGRRSAGRSIARAHGLSVWFPEARYDYLVFRPKYLELDGTRGGGWDEFLSLYHA